MIAANRSSVEDNKIADGGSDDQKNADENLKICFILQYPPAYLTTPLTSQCTMIEWNDIVTRT
jgi:hypothetical protein